MAERVSSAPSGASEDGSSSGRVVACAVSANMTSMHAAAAGMMVLRRIMEECTSPRGFRVEEEKTAPWQGGFISGLTESAVAHLGRLVQELCLDRGERPVGRRVHVGRSEGGDLVAVLEGQDEA